MGETRIKAKTNAGKVRLSCRINPSTKNRAEEAARVLGQSVTTFTEDAIAKRANEVLAARDRVLVSERDFAAFVNAINQPADAPTARLLADVAHYKAQHTG